LCSKIDPTYAPGIDGVYQTTAHSFGNPEQFSLQPSASQGHIAGGFARHRYDLKTQLQQQQQAAAAAAAAAFSAQQNPADKLDAVVGRGEVINGVIQPLANASSSSQRASTSLSALR